MRKIIWLTFLLTLAIITGWDKSNNERAFKSKIGVGSPAPDFTLRDMNEKNITLSGYKGKVVFITFWNMKCKNCTESMQSLEALSRRTLLPQPDTAPCINSKTNRTLCG